MIRARAEDGDGRPVILLGLSDENLRRLGDDQIRVDLAELGFAVGAPLVLLFGGGTEAELADRLLGSVPDPELRRRIAVDLVRDGLLDEQRRKAHES